MSNEEDASQKIIDICLISLGNPGVLQFKGNIIFEIAGVKPDVARQAMSLAAYKLPLKTKFISKVS